MNKQNFLRNSGFTLTEMMLTVAIVSILATVSAPMLLRINRFFVLTQTRTELQNEARSIMYVITRALHQADSNSILLDRLDNSQPFYSRLTFAKIQGTNMSFRQNGKKLEQVMGNNTKTLSKNLRYLAFTFPRSDDITIISVSFTLEKAIYEGQKKALHMASEKVQVMN